MRDFHDDGNLMRFVNHLRLFRRLVIVVVIPVVCVIAWVGGAQAQTAGGDGHALDANQSKTQGRSNGLKKRFLLNNINNAIVTGNVAGGKGFRGNLGYTAAGDFRGQAGSDDLFSFSADSYLPGLVFERTNLLQVPSTRGMTNARYQSGLQPSLILRRSTAGVSYSSRPFTSHVNQRQLISSDPSGTLGQVERPSLLRRSMTDAELQRRYRSQYRYSVSTVGVGGLGLTEGDTDRVGSMKLLRSYLLRRNSGEELGSGRAEVAGRSYLDLFGMISGQERGRKASERGLPEMDVKRGTPNEKIDRLLEKIDEKVKGEGNSGG